MDSGTTSWIVDDAAAAAEAAEMSGAMNEAFNVEVETEIVVDVEVVDVNVDTVEDEVEEVEDFEVTIEDTTVAEGVGILE